MSESAKKHIMRTKEVKEILDINRQMIDAMLNKDYILMQNLQILLDFLIGEALDKKRELSNETEG